MHQLLGSIAKADVNNINERQCIACVQGNNPSSASYVLGLYAVSGLSMRNVFGE